MYKFIGIYNLEEFLLNQLGVEFLIPNIHPNTPDELTFFHNGDKMIINLKLKTMIWEPIKQGDMFTSRLSMKFHQWFGNGYIKYVGCMNIDS